MSTKQQSPKEEPSRRPLRVALVTGSYPPLLCGVADYCRHLVRALRARGLVVEVYTRMRREADRRRPETLRAEEQGVHRTVTRWGWREIRRLAGRIAGFRPDLVHLQYQTALFDKGLSMTLFPHWVRSRVPGARVIVTFHDLNGPRVIPRVPASGRPALRFLAGRAQGVVVTNELDSAVVSSWGLGGAGLLLSPVGPTIPVVPMSAERRRSLRCSLEVGEEETLLVYFGLVMRDKGLTTLIEALAQLPPGGWKLLLIASPRDRREERWREELCELARSRGVERHLRWRERLSPPDVSAHLGASDVGVLPFEEGISTRRSSFAVLAAHGLPLVTTTPREWPRIFGEESPALLVPPRHPTELARALETLLAPGEQRAELTRRSWALAARLSWAKTARDTEELYRRALADERGSAPADLPSGGDALRFGRGSSSSSEGPRK